MNRPEKVCRQGFTLVEMMLVVLIIGILAAAVVAGLPDAGDKTRTAVTRTTIDTIRGAITRFEMELGRYPTDLRELVIEGDEKWPGPFLDCTEVPRDGWGNEFKYEIAGKRVKVTSAAKDGQFGTSDDIWK
jgi:general secretion pathway protein G